MDGGLNYDTNKKAKKLPRESYLLLLRDRFVTLSSPLNDSGPIRMIWFPVMNRFLVYPGIPVGILRKSLETHFTVRAASEHSQRGGHDAWTEASSAQKTMRCAKTSMLERKVCGPRSASRNEKETFRKWIQRNAPLLQDIIIIRCPDWECAQLCISAESVAGRQGRISMRTKLGVALSRGGVWSFAVAKQGVVSSATVKLKGPSPCVMICGEEPLSCLHPVRIHEIFRLRTNTRSRDGWGGESGRARSSLSLYIYCFTPCSFTSCGVSDAGKYSSHPLEAKRRPRYGNPDFYILQIKKIIYFPEVNASV